jgi:hypothetical protein
VSSLTTKRNVGATSTDFALRAVERVPASGVAPPGRPVMEA